MIHYYPFSSGKYHISAGLHPLGKDFGNGQNDQQIFQIDDTWKNYYLIKQQARTEKLGKYYCLDKYRPELERIINKWLITHLSKEHPKHFKLEHTSKTNCSLKCLLSGERLIFDTDFQLIEVHSAKEIVPGYVSTFDALACQLQEDLAVVEINNNHDHLVLLHLCFPNHWAAEDKIGKNFVDVHKPVPGMQKINQASHQLLKTLISASPCVRFAWGVATDNRLNHHPEPPDDCAEPSSWHGRLFDATNPKLFIRIERQVITGFPEINSFLFTIRTYFEDVSALNHENKVKLSAAIKSMSSDSLIYKGMYDQKNDILHWIDSS